MKKIYLNIPYTRLFPQEQLCSIFKMLFLLCFFLFCYQFTLSAFTISPEAAQLIGEKIWKNECRGTIEGLTHWNKGENFGSFGIGHFIWYPKNQQERFQETFPELLIFLENEGVCFPSWLKSTKGSPWKSREEFYQRIQSAEMTELRQFLFETKDLQISFILMRLKKSLPEMTKSLSYDERDRFITTFSQLSEIPNGLYALIDYSNFKGMGTLSSESYKGQGWGLAQVIKNMPSSSKASVDDFVKSAKEILIQRVKNSPPERHEEKWLKGWLERLDTYLIPFETITSSRV
jgi:hypothetical protein